MQQGDRQLPSSSSRVRAEDPRTLSPSGAFHFCKFSDRGDRAFMFGGDSGPVATRDSEPMSPPSPAGDNDPVVRCAPFVRPRAHRGPAWQWRAKESLGQWTGASALPTFASASVRDELPIAVHRSRDRRRLPRLTTRDKLRPASADRRSDVEGLHRMTALVWLLSALHTFGAGSDGSKLWLRVLSPPAALRVG